jgi:hypothetical protein
MVTGEVIVSTPQGNMVVPVKVISKGPSIKNTVVVQAIKGEPFAGFSLNAGYYPLSTATVFKENVYNVRDTISGETVHTRPNLRVEFQAQ